MASNCVRKGENIFGLRRLLTVTFIAFVFALACLVDKTESSRETKGLKSSRSSKEKVSGMFRISFEQTWVMAPLHFNDVFSDFITLCLCHLVEGVRDQSPPNVQWLCVLLYSLYNNFNKVTTFPNSLFICDQNKSKTYLFKERLVYLFIIGNRRDD